MRCNKCGTEVSNPGVSFCPTCGNYLQEVKDNEKKIGGIVKVENDDKKKSKLTSFIIVGVFVVIIIILEIGRAHV